MTKGIILAGGTGARLRPITYGVSKQLLPVYDKPMIYYPLVTLMRAGIADILIITRPEELGLFRALLGDGTQWGIAISYATQAAPRGIAEALIIAEPFCAGGRSVLVLGDTFLHGAAADAALSAAMANPAGAGIFLHKSDVPEQFGVATLDERGAVVDLEEKPRNARSSYAVIGLYCYDGKAAAAARSLMPSARGELEITDLNRWYMNRGLLRAGILPEGSHWLDMGTLASLAHASRFVETEEKKSGRKIGCPEEVAFRQGRIGSGDLLRLAEPLYLTEYGDYLVALARAGNPTGTERS